MKKNWWHGGGSFEKVYLVNNFGTKDIYVKLMKYVEEAQAIEVSLQTG